MALVTVNGVPLPEASAYSATDSTLVDSGRNVNGRWVGSVIRSNVSKIDLKWNYLTASSWTSVLGQFVNFTASVYFYNQSTGGFETKTMYVSDRQAELHNLDVNGNITGWKNCSLNLIEV